MVTHTARGWINRVSKVANPARVSCTEKINTSLSPFAPENFVS